jgi:DNA-binding PadR family transcriptional regulator
MSPPRLTTASYALLGLLSSQPFSAYELTKHMKRSALAELWPRTEASLYKEPKVLEAHGYVTAAVARNGARSRTVYSITPAGRRALRDWLRAPGAGLVFECEAATKAFFGDAGTLAGLREHLRSLTLHDDGADAPLERLRALRDGDVRFPERLHYTAMAADLVARIRLAVDDWATDWLDRTESWAGTAIDPGARAQAGEVLDDLVAQLQRRARRAGPARTVPRARASLSGTAAPPRTTGPRR